MSKTIPFFFLVFLTALLSACNFPTFIDTEATPESPVLAEDSLSETFPVDPLFNDFYNALGGSQILGPAISPLQEFENLSSQYVEAGLMVYDPQAPLSDRYRMAPLGLVLDVAEPPVPDPQDMQKRYLNGHIIFPEFEAFYERLGGAQYVGRPLTEARHNPVKLRIEQYFENLGFYRLDHDEPGKVRLIAYGAYVCDQRCRYQAHANRIPSLRPFLPEPFASYAAQLGLEVLGRTLGEPRLAEDGNLEVIFEHVVMVIQPLEQELSTEGAGGLPFQVTLPLVLMTGPRLNEAGATVPDLRFWLPLIRNGPQVMEQAFLLEEKSILEQESLLEQKIALRPLPSLVGIERSSPVQKGENDPLMVFFPVEGNLGFPIPRLFNDWILHHGGYIVSGPPITEVTPVEDGIYRQCFENLCLDFYPSAPAGEQLRPARLGIEYRNRFYSDLGETGNEEFFNNLRLQVVESQPFVGPDEAQEIRVLVHEDGVPLANREPVITLTMPDDSRQVHQLEPTDENGETILRIEPIQAPNGTLIAYEVCLSGLDERRFCIEDHYLIWGKP